MSEWNFNMGEAPRDGTRFLAIQTTPGDWFENIQILSVHQYHKFQDGTGMWFGHGGMLPDAWQHLPPPPPGEKT